MTISPALNYQHTLKSSHNTSQILLYSWRAYIKRYIYRRRVLSAHTSTTILVQHGGHTVRTNWLLVMAHTSLEFDLSFLIIRLAEGVFRYDAHGR
jgi:hypothetical protein